jgi:hypothetical protein
VDGAPIAVEAATAANIQGAFDRWYGRLNASEANVGLFYFCGHGIEREHQLLLAEDFGESANQPWRNSYNFNMTHHGMAECKAQAQCYFIDACRNVPSGVLRDEYIDAPSLKRSRSGAWRPRDAPIFFGATRGERAFGEPGMVSRFTSVLIKALGGASATRIDGKWVVDTDSLRACVPKLTRLAYPDVEQVQSPARGGESVGSTPIHHLATAPPVEVRIACRPDEATSAATLYIAGVKGVPVYERPPGSTLWRRQVDAGVYAVGARFEGAGYNDVEDHEWVEPPVFERYLEVR